MKTFLLVGLIAACSVCGFLLGKLSVNQRATRAAARYEIHSSGIPGMLVRLDKVTGATEIVAPAQAASPPRIDFVPDHEGK